MFSTKEEAENALKLNNTILENNHLRVDKEEKQNDYESTVFVGNIPFKATEEDIRTHFSPIGDIISVRLIRDKETLLCKGIGYVQLSSKEEMKKAIEDLNGSSFMGRPLRIKKAVESK